MTTQIQEKTPEVVLDRIDTIIVELMTLRQIVSTMQVVKQPANVRQPVNLAMQLSGSLGMAALGELDYSEDTYLELFAS